MDFDVREQGMDYCFVLTNLQLSLHKTLLESQSHVEDWIIVMFLSAVWTLILVAPIHCRGSTGEKVMRMLNFSKTVHMKKQTHLHLGCPESE